MIKAIKFSNAETDKVDILNGLTPKDFLKRVYLEGRFGLDNLKRHGKYLRMGWAYDFNPYIKTFVYKQYGTWSECNAPNKTLLRKVISGRIDKIIEVV